MSGQLLNLICRHNWSIYLVIPNTIFSILGDTGFGLAISGREKLPTRNQKGEEEGEKKKKSVRKDKDTPWELNLQPGGWMSTRSSHQAKLRWFIADIIVSEMEAC